MNHLEEKYANIRKLSLREFRKIVFRRDPKLDYGKKYDFIPTMVSKERQLKWTGCEGQKLAKNTYDFVSLMMLHAYRSGLPNNRDLNILDYGCGWGRMLRLMPYFTNVNNLYGVDPTTKSIELCEEYNVPAKVAVISPTPEKLPFDQKFDLIYAYSVFTHMRDDVAAHAMSIFKKHISDDGMVCITIRPRRYWEGRPSGGNITPQKRDQLLNAHDKNGYSFMSYAENKHGGPENWGDSTFTLDYIRKQWKDWEIVKMDVTDTVPLQRLVFLKPI